MRWLCEVVYEQRPEFFITQMQPAKESRNIVKLRYVLFFLSLSFEMLLLANTLVIRLSIFWNLQTSDKCYSRQPPIRSVPKAGMVYYYQLLHFSILI